MTREERREVRSGRQLCEGTEMLARRGAVCHMCPVDKERHLQWVLGHRRAGRGCLGSGAARDKVRVVLPVLGWVLPGEMCRGPFVAPRCKHAVKCSPDDTFLLFQVGNFDAHLAFLQEEQEMYFI